MIRKTRKTWMTSLAIVTTSLVLAAPAAAQLPGSGGKGSGSSSGGTPAAPGAPGTTTPPTPGSTTPQTPGATTPGLPNPANPSAPPGVNDPSRNPTFPCPPGQARRPGTSVCSPTIPSPR